MPRQVIRIYLASSPDLNEERRLLLGVLQELNETKGAEQSVIFQMVNFDPPGPGAEIRRDAQIANSDLFVLMLGKSWEERSSPGQPTSIERGFRFAQSAFEHNGRPRLLIYFRSVLPAMMADPGAQLQQIIQFRDAIEASRAQQFTIYDHPLQWRAIFRSHLSRWLINPQDDPGHLPAFMFPRQVNDSLSLRLRDEFDLGASPDRRRAVDYAIKALDLLDGGRFTAAEERFSRALDMDDGPEVLHSFGVYLQRIGSLDRAEKIFQRLLTNSLADDDIDPIYQSLALTNLGLVYAQRAANEPGIIGIGSTGSLVADYLRGRRGWKSVNLRDSLEHLPYTSSRNTLAHGLATAFRSRDTEPFGHLVSHLYHYSPIPPRIEVLRTLVSNAGGATAVAKFAPDGSYLAELGRLSNLQAITEREAAEAAPEVVRILATRAEQKNPLTVDKISRIYSGYPEIVKNLGPKPLSITLSSMAEREAVNPRKLFLMNSVFAKSPEDQQVWKISDPSYPKGSYVTSVESTEEEPPSSLVANSWFEDENGNALELRTSFIAGRSYKYLFAIEKVKRLLLLGRSDVFKEPSALARAGNTKVELEVICPLLKTKNPHKVARRSVRYYSGTGIRPQSFRLAAGTPGDYLLTLRVFYIRRLLYRTVVRINVANKELRRIVATNDRLSWSNENLRGDHV